MTAPVMKPEGSAASRNGTADRWISRAAAVTVVGLAGIAAALSYSHMRQLAQDHGQTGWHAHAFPLSVDGIEIVASLVLLADRRAGRRSGCLSWTALTAGTIGSLAANIAAAHPDPVSRVIAGWPAVALLIAVKLLSGILERHEAPESNSTAVSESALTALSPEQPDQSSIALATGTTDRADDPVTSQPVPPRLADDETAGIAKPPDIDDLPPAAALLPAARLARDELHRDGLALTRDALAARLRRHGHPVRNASLTSLLRDLRREPEPAHPTRSPPADRPSVGLHSNAIWLRKQASLECVRE